MRVRVAAGEAQGAIPAIPCPPVQGLATTQALYNLGLSLCLDSPNEAGAQAPPFRTGQPTWGSGTVSKSMLHPIKGLSSHISVLSPSTVEEFWQSQPKWLWRFLLLHGSFTLSQRGLLFILGPCYSPKVSTAFSHGFHYVPMGGVLN